MKNGIVIPCYNESNRLQFGAFKKFITEHSDYLLCFVNDGSKDDTLELLKEFSKTSNRVLIYNMPENGGKAEAVRQGSLYMLNNTPVETVGFLDADLSTDFNDYKRLVDSLDQNKNLQIAFGSRKAEVNENINRSLFRSIASFLVGFIIKSILQLNIKDTQCGAKVLSREIAWHCFNTAFITKWIFDVELFVRFRRYNSGKNIMSKMKEIPLNKWEDVEGSKLSTSDAIQIPLQLANIFFVYNMLPLLNEITQSVGLTILSLTRLQSYQSRTES